MFKKASALLIGALMVASLAACASESPGTSGTAGGGGSGSQEIWYSTKNSTELVHVAMANGVVDAATMLGFSGDVAVAEADAAKQNDQLNNLVQNIRPAAIVVNPYDSDSVSDVLGRANDAEIPVAVIDNTANNAEVDVAVLFDSVASGELAGQEAVRLLTEKYGEPKGTVVNLYGEVVSQVFKDRSAGFEKVIKENPDIELISVLGAPESDVATSALNNVIADAKASGKTIDLVNTPTDTATLGAIEALKTNGMWHTTDSEDHVAVISHDGLGDILTLVKEGYVDVEIVVDILGVGGIATEVLAAYPLKGEAVPTSGTFTPKGEYLNTEVTFSSGPTGATVMLPPIAATQTEVDNPLIWGNVGE
ncbi:MAG: sugar ABC transporter substrate-binding protein [Propioniciclava sp.]